MRSALKKRSGIGFCSLLLGIFLSSDHTARLSQQSDCKWRLRLGMTANNGGIRTTTALGFAGLQRRTRRRLSSSDANYLQKQETSLKGQGQWADRSVSLPITVLGNPKHCTTTTCTGEKYRMSCFGNHEAIQLCCPLEHHTTLYNF